MRLTVSQGVVLCPEVGVVTVVGESHRGDGCRSAVGPAGKKMVRLRRRLPRGVAPRSQAPLACVRRRSATPREPTTRRNFDEVRIVIRRVTFAGHDWHGRSTSRRSCARNRAQRMGKERTSAPGASRPPVRSKRRTCAAAANRMSRSRGRPNGVDAWRWSHVVYARLPGRSE